MEPLALPIRARFVPLRGHPDCSPDWCMPCIPVGGFSAVLLALGGGLVVFVPAAGAGCRIGPRPPIEAATEAATECARRWDWNQRSRSCTCRGPVMHLSCTRRIAVPVTGRITGRGARLWLQ